MIGILTLVAWINRENMKLYSFFYEHSKLYWTLYAVWAILRIWALIGRWGRETSDEDYTSLQMANHPLRGILPLTASTRWIFILVALGERYWWRAQHQPDDDDDEEDHFR